MSQSQSIIILSSSCTGNDIPSNDTVASPEESSMSHPLSGSSSSFYLQSLPIVCDILMLPELPDEASEALSLPRKRLNPCGIDNVLRMHNFGQSAMLMSLTSCHVVAAAKETDPVVLPVQPIPSTFVIDSHKQTSATNPVPSLDVAFGFDIALQQWGQFLKVAAMPKMTNNNKNDNDHMQDAKLDGSTMPAKNESYKGSCDLTLEPFYQDLIRSSFQQSATTKGSFVSENPEMVFKHLQMITEKEAQDLDRIMTFLGIVGIFLLGLLWWSGREMFRASRTESVQMKRIQHAIQEMEQQVHREQKICNVTSPAVASKSPRRALNFVTPSSPPPQQQQQVACNQPNRSASTPIPSQEASQGESSVCDTPPTLLLSQEQTEDPFQVLGVSPVQKIDDFEHQEETPIESEEDASDHPEEEIQVVQMEENEQQEYESDEESTPVLLLLTTSLSINRKHVAHQERIKTLLESNKLDQVEIVDGADPSKKALRNALFQLSGLRAVYPQLFVSRGSKLRFVGDFDKVQHLHDEQLMTEKDIFNSKENDWQHLEDIISATPSMDESFANHESASSTSTEHEDRGFLPCSSLPTSKSQSTASLEADTNSKDSVQLADSVSTAIQEGSSNATQDNSITSSEVNVSGHDAFGEVSIHSTDSCASTPYLQSSLPPAESHSITSIQADSDSNGDGEDSIHSTDSGVLSTRTPDASSASTPSSKRSLSPYAKMAKAWEERRLGKSKGGKLVRPKLQPLALQWNTGTNLLNKAGGGVSPPNNQDASQELPSTTTTENSGNRTTLVPCTEQISIVPVAPCEVHDQEESLDATAPPPSLEVTCSSPGSQADGASFIEDYWW